MKRTEIEIDRSELCYLSKIGPFLITTVASESRKTRFLTNGWIEETGETYKGFPVYVVSAAGSAFTGDAGSRPAPSMAYAIGDVVTEAHARYCREYGHSTYKVDGVSIGVCPRCGDVTHADDDRAERHYHESLASADVESSACDG